MSCSIGANANRMRIGIVEEEEFGVLPDPPITMETLRWTSEGLKQTTSTVNSNEVRADRQISDVKRVDIGADGPINFEMSYGSHQNLMEGALYSAGWSSPETVTASTISFDNADNSINDSGDGLGDFTENQWIRVTGSDNNDGFYKIVSVASGKLVVTGGTITDESAGASVTILQGGQIVNGVACKTFAIEKAFTDLSNEYVRYLGMLVNQLTITANVGQIITGSASFIGIREESSSSPIGNTYNAATTSRVMAAVDEIQGFFEGNTTKSIQQCSFALANNARQQMVLGNLGPAGLGDGSINVTGTFRCYFQSKALMDKYLNYTDTSIALALWDNARNGYVIECPRVNYTDGQRVAGGINTDIMADLSWSAKMHETEGVTIRIARFPAS